MAGNHSSQNGDVFMVPYIVVGVIVLAILAVVAYYMARFMKGRLKLNLSRNTAGSGESFSGDVSLEAKKSIHGLLKISLVGREEQRRRSSSRDGDSTEWVEVYRQDCILEEARDFPSGFTKTYSFEMVAPTSSEARQGGSMLREMGEKAGDGVMGSMVKMAASVADMTRGRLKWHVESRLDADGVDLFTKQKVHVNLRD
jgi:hypothetical protein